MPGTEDRIVDHALLLSLREQLGRTVLGEYVEQALQEAERTCSELQGEGIPHSQAVSLAHYLRGTTASFGLSSIAASAAAIEEHAHAAGSLCLLVLELASAIENTRRELRDTNASV